MQFSTYFEQYFTHDRQRHREEHQYSPENWHPRFRQEENQLPVPPVYYWGTSEDRTGMRDFGCSLTPGYFALSLFMITATDQHMHCRYNDRYETFQACTNYPKFGQPGRMRNPGEIIQIAQQCGILSPSIVTNTQLVDFVDSWWQFLQNLFACHPEIGLEVADFFREIVRYTVFNLHACLPEIRSLIVSRLQRSLIIPELISSTGHTLWQPSAGRDLKGIDNWFALRGNTLRPSVCYFTDTDYHLFPADGRIEFHGIALCSGLDQEYEISFASIPLIRAAREGNLLPGLIPRQNGATMEISAEDYFELCRHALFGVLVRREVRVTLTGDLNLWCGPDAVCGLEARHFEPVVNIQGNVYLAGHPNLIRENFNHIAVTGEIFEDYAVDQLEAGLVHLPQRNVHVYVLPISNEDFYHRCIPLGIDIHCIYAKRTACDLSFLNCEALPALREIMTDMRRNLCVPPHLYEPIGTFRAQATDFLNDAVTLFRPRVAPERAGMVRVQIDQNSFSSGRAA